MPYSQLPITPMVSSADTKVCVIIGHSIDAITTSVVLASLNQRVHLFADAAKLATTLGQYNFEHHLQALWQLYGSQQKIECFELPKAPFEAINRYQPAQATDSGLSAKLYWLFLNSIQDDWLDTDWVTAFNHSQQQACPIILSGTVTIGKIDSLAQKLRRAWVYYVPFVFLQDGAAFSSMLTPMLWLLGTKTPNSAQHLSMLRPLMQQAKAYHQADIATIEFARSSIMAMLATRVSFMNEMSRLADVNGVDIQKVSQIMGLDERVGSSYLTAGWGFGGNTLPLELEALQQSSTDCQIAMPLLDAVGHINDDQKELIFRKFWQYFDGFIDNKTVMIWGASYKADSGRTASSAIHPLLALLWSYNIKTRVYSDKAKGELLAQYKNEPLLEIIDSPYEGIKGAQAMFLLSASHQEPIDIAQINQVGLPVFDAQNILSRSQIEALVGDYRGLGRSK
ncbi:UDP-glucose/GDP-mannose dehydrogenase family protein [Psychrobacter ciconiae]|uniref:UDP-glucose/GDP-mannose dehydrogenase family protein n=1 Tax=Psychrobacter ciconiae TaxID=1553449 RepID=UPI001917A9DA|nr:UDP-glucose/GDP-mannose dehydrogenase family protein [Psychrobacter ciconiae]